MSGINTDLQIDEPVYDIGNMKNNVINFEKSKSLIPDDLMTFKEIVKDYLTVQSIKNLFVIILAIVPLFVALNVTKPHFSSLFLALLYFS